MKNWWFICLSLLLLYSCDFKKDTTNNVDSAVIDNIIDNGYISKVGWFEQKKYEMLAMPDDEYNFWFSDDWELQELDPHAFWLMNRMMQMVQMIKTADDGWAWLLAMNESVEMYNERLGRKVGNPELALTVIENLLKKYGAGNQAEMNAASYVYMIEEHYKTLYKYYNLIDYFDDTIFENEVERYKKMQNLIYQEYAAWFDLNNAINGLMTFYTYGAARYSSAPMDINSYFEYWSKKRNEELQVERDLYINGLDQPYKDKVEKVSPDDFKDLINYYKTRTLQTVMDEYLKDWDEKDYEYAKERLGGYHDFARIDEVMEYYEEALQRWRIVRKLICDVLPEKDKKDYNNITANIYARFYNDLLDLKQISY